MPALESIKKLTEKATGWARPKKAKLNTLVQTRKPNFFLFKDDGIIPNHPTFPLILYRGAVRFPDDLESRGCIRRCLRQEWLGRLLAEWHLRLRALPLENPRSARIARGNGSVQF